MAVGPEALSLRTFLPPSQTSLPGRPSPSPGRGPASHLPVPPLPPRLIKDPANQNQRQRPWWRDLAGPKPALSAPERSCSPKEAGRRKADGCRSNYITLSSQQMLGTIRINGLEIQVRAIQGSDYSQATLHGRKG